MITWEEKMKPRKMIKLFDAYMQTKELQKKDPNIKLPIIELSLSNRQAMFPCLRVFEGWH